MEMENAAFLTCIMSLCSFDNECQFVKSVAPQQVTRLPPVGARTFLDNHPKHTEPGWRLFAVMRTVPEFWQGTTDRSHQRLRYANTENEGNWQKQVLWP